MGLDRFIRPTLVILTRKHQHKYNRKPNRKINDWGNMTFDESSVNITSVGLINRSNPIVMNLSCTCLTYITKYSSHVFTVVLKLNPQIKLYIM